MSEQELADLFSAQIDRILGGESAMAVATNGDLSLLSLGQQLAQLNFQASPAAQAAFQSQLVSWFGKMGGSSLTTGFGLSKILLMSVGAITMIGAGLGLVVLISFTWTGALFNPTNKNQPVPAVTQPAPSSSPEVTLPDLAPEPPAPTTPTRPSATSSLKDVLPPVVTDSVGDTLPRPPSSSTPTETVPPTTATPGDNGVPGGDDSSSGSDASSDTPPAGDDDRGHGNDPDGSDEDNTGQSEGLPSGTGQNNDNGGTLPGNLSGGNGGGGGSGSGNGSGQGDNENNQGVGQGGKKQN